MNIGQKIKEKRESKGLNQYQLSKSLKNLNQSQISKIEKGKRKVSAEELFEITKVLGIPTEEFI